MTAAATARAAGGGGAARAGAMLGVLLLAAPRRAAAWRRDELRELRALRAARVGTSYWYGEGELVSLRTGRVLAAAEALEVCRDDARHSNATAMAVLCRKLSVFRDPASGEVLVRRDGVGLAVSAQPALRVTAALDGGAPGAALRVRARAHARAPALEATCAHGGRARTPHGRVLLLSPALHAPPAEPAAERAEPAVALNVRAPLGLTFSTGGNAGARAAAAPALRELERYAYWRARGRVLGTCTKLGPAPHWAGGARAGPCLLSLRCVRLRRWRALPRTLRRFVDAELPGWRHAPRRLEGEPAPRRWAAWRGAARAAPDGPRPPGPAAGGG